MTLTRRTALALGGAALLAPRPAVARNEYHLTPVAVADGIWMIEGSTEYFSTRNGGAIVNCTLLSSTDGIIVVDTGSSLRYGEALARLAQQLDQKGVAAVINTHHHPDHVFGNQALASAPILALRETKSLVETHGDALADNMYRLLGDWMRGTEVVPPTKVATGGDQEIGGRTLEFLPLLGHTEADLAVIDKRTGTLIAGDLAFLDRAPTTPSADLTLWKQSIEFLQAVNASAIIPGHGPLDRSGFSLTQTKDYITWLEATLRRAAGEGLDMIEIMDTPLPLHFARMGAMPQEYHRSVAHLYPDIEKSVLPRAN